MSSLQKNQASGKTYVHPVAIQKQRFTIVLLLLMVLHQVSQGQTVALSLPLSSTTYVDNVINMFTISDPAGTPQSIKVIYTYTSGYYLSLNPPVMTATMKANTPAPGSWTLNPTDMANAANVYTSSLGSASMYDGTYSVYCQYIRPASAGSTVLSSTTRTNVTIDTKTLPPAILSPAANATVGDGFTFLDSVPEAYATGTKTITIGTSVLTMANSKLKDTIVFNLNDLAASSANIVSVSGPASIPDGNYTIVLSYQDFTGHAAASYSRSITIDRITQTPVINAPASSASIGQYLNLNFTLPETPLAGSVTATLDNGGTPVIITLTNVSTGVNSMTLNTYDLSSSSYVQSSTSMLLSSGTYSVMLSYQDAASNATAFATVNNVVIDNQTDKAVITAPVNNGVVMKSLPFTLAFTLPETPIANSVQVLFMNGGSSCTAALNTNASGLHSMTIDPKNLAACADIVSSTSSSLADGVYAIQVRYSDSLGNHYSDSDGDTLVLDSRTLTPALVLPGNSSTNSGTMNVSFNLPEMALNNKVNLRLTQDCNTIDIVLATTGSGLQTFALNGSNILSSPGVISSTQSTIPTGTYSMILSYGDAYGNPAAFSVQSQISF